MKIRIKKQKNGEWLTQINRGNGGISSLIIARQSRSFFNSIRILFSFKNIRRALN